MFKKHTNIFFIGVAVLFLTGITVNFVKTKKTIQTVNTLKEKTHKLNAIAVVGAQRASDVNKIYSVINRFNPGLPEETKLAISNEILDADLKYANLDVDLILATITHESARSWNPEIVSPAGALGLMQVMPATGQFLAKIEGLKWNSPEEVLFNPVYNIRLGSRYLSGLIEMYEVDGGLAAYNGGGRRAEMWLAQNRADGVLFKETQEYVPAVLSLYEEFRQ